MYNNKYSCCQQAIEKEQALHFNYWRQILTAKIDRVKKSMRATAAVEGHDVFNSATPGDRLQFRRALEAYGAAVDPASHARCFSSLLAYVAGMVCFGCMPEWKDRVQMGTKGVIRIHIAETSCTRLWAFCEGFSERAKALRQAVLDSWLAVQQPTPLEYLNMFDDQQSLCDWTHDAIALHPFTTPGEAEKEATPPASAMARRRLEPAPVAVKEYDTIKEGRQSGFDTSWDGVTGLSASISLRPCRSWALLAAAIAIVGGSRSSSDSSR